MPYHLVADGAGVEGLLTGSGVTVVGLLLVAVLAFVRGYVHADKTVQKRYADYEEEISKERERTKAANDRADKWEQRAWDSFQTSKQAVSVAQGTLDVATKKVSP